MAAANSVYLALMISLTSLLLPSALSQDLALVHTQETGEAAVTSADAEPPESSDQVIILASDWLTSARVGYC